eukprot:tig00020848_g14610.t1
MADDEEQETPEQRSKSEAQGSRDMERVTDFTEEKELDVAKVRKAMSSITAAEDLEAQARERELAAVVVKKDDIEFMERELEITKQEAEQAIREHKGDVTAAVRSFLQV